MKINKSRLRTKVTDGHLDAVMCIVTVFHSEAKFFNIGPMKTCPMQRFFSANYFRMYVFGNVNSCLLFCVIKKFVYTV